jgi:hypothetical protein
VGAKKSKSHPPVHTPQILETADQYQEEPSPLNLVLQTPATPADYGYPTLEAPFSAAYAPDSSSYDLEYYLPLPQDSESYQIEDSPDAPDIIGDDILSAIKVQAAGKVAVSSFIAQ